LTESASFEVGRSRAAVQAIAQRSVIKRSTHVLQTAPRAAQPNKRRALAIRARSKPGSRQVAGNVVSAGSASRATLAGAARRSADRKRPAASIRFVDVPGAFSLPERDASVGQRSRPIPAGTGRPGADPTLLVNFRRWNAIFGRAQSTRTGHREQNLTAHVQGEVQTFATHAEERVENLLDPYGSRRAKLHSTRRFRTARVVASCRHRAGSAPAGPARRPPDARRVRTARGCWHVHDDCAGRNGRIDILETADVRNVNRGRLSAPQPVRYRRSTRGFRARLAASRRARVARSPFT